MTTWRFLVRRLARDLVVLAVAAAVFSAAFAVGDLIIYGHVRW